MRCDLICTGRVYTELRCVRCSRTSLVAASSRKTRCPNGDDCEYQPTGLVLYEMQCQRDKCKQVITSKYADPRMRTHTCRAGSEPRSALSKAWSLAEATARWVAAGSPVRTAEAVVKLFDVCRKCPEFRGNDANGNCGICGCNLKKSGGLLNKIKMATEDCPLGKWLTASSPDGS